MLTFHKKKKENMQVAAQKNINVTVNPINTDSIIHLKL